MVQDFQGVMLVIELVKTWNKTEWDPAVVDTHLIGALRRVNRVIRARLLLGSDNSPISDVSWMPAVAHIDIN